MADYFVSTLDGSDSTGTGTATNPWKTIDKAIGSSPAITLPGSGTTTVWLAPGVYWEAVALGLSPSSSASLVIAGDVDGAAFAAGGKSSPRTGIVDWRCWTDSATPINDYAFSASSKSNVTLQRLKITGGGKSAIWLNQTGSVAIRDCVFTAGVSAQNVVENRGASSAPGLTIERCRFAGGGGVSLSLNLRFFEEAATWDAAVRVADCVFDGGYRHVVIDRISGTGGGLPSGIAIQGCTLRGPSQQSIHLTAALPASAVAVYGCSFVHAGTAIQAQTLGQIVENGNGFYAVGTPRTNVTEGANSLVDRFPAFDFGEGLIDGSRLRPNLEPLPGSPALGAGQYGTPSATDLFGRARPNPCAAGALELAADPPGPACPPSGGVTYIFQTEG